MHTVFKIYKTKFIYVNDLKNATSCHPRLFADDTCLVLDNPSLKELENDCNSELRRLHTWCNANELQINPEKSTAIFLLFDGTVLL